MKNTLVSAYHLYGKPGNSGENLSGMVYPGGNFRKKSTFRGITFFPFLPKRPKLFVPFVLLTSARRKVICFNPGPLVIWAQMFEGRLALTRG